jgi:hypothetical protein
VLNDSIFCIRVGLTEKLNKVDETQISPFTFVNVQSLDHFLRKDFYGVLRYLTLSFKATQRAFFPT